MSLLRSCPLFVRIVSFACCNFVLDGEFNLRVIEPTLVVRGNYWEKMCRVVVVGFLLLAGGYCDAYSQGFAAWRVSGSHSSIGFGGSLEADGVLTFVPDARTGFGATLGIEWLAHEPVYLKGLLDFVIGGGRTPIFARIGSGYMQGGFTHAGRAVFAGQLGLDGETLGLTIAQGTRDADALPIEIGLIYELEYDLSNNPTTLHQRIGIGFAICSPIYEPHMPM